MKAVLDFLKTLLSHKDRSINILLYDESTLQDSSSSFRIRPRILLNLVVAGGVLLTIAIVALIAFTPIKSLVVPGAGQDLRQQVIEVSRQVKALEDTIEVREQQLNEMKQVLLQEKDTTFQVKGTEMPVSGGSGRKTKNVQMDLFYSPVTPAELVSQTDLVNSNRINRAPEFPVAYPVDGTFTRGMNRENRHFGIDIATASGTPVYAIADGTVIGSSWTPNYGYVLRIQHARGYVSVYKHCMSLMHDEGDVVQKGSLVGEVGDAGILSSGPHLHFELWKRGVPLNPKQFLIETS